LLLLAQKVDTGVVEERSYRVAFYRVATAIDDWLVLNLVDD
jgi:hypothetical protein